MISCDLRGKTRRLFIEFRASEKCLTQSNKATNLSYTRGEHDEKRSLTGTARCVYNLGEMNIPEWIALCAPFAACAAACVVVLRHRGGRLPRSAAVDAGLVFGGIILIGLDKHLFEPFAPNFATGHIDDFCVGPAALGMLNLLLAAMRRAPLRSLAGCFAYTVCVGFFLEFGYPRFSAHAGGDWIDFAAYVAGGIAAAALRKLLAKI